MCCSASRTEPFAEVNWLHNTKDYGVNMTDATTTIRGRNNMVEITAGIEGHFKNNLHLWGIYHSSLVSIISVIRKV